MAKSIHEYELSLHAAWVSRTQVALPRLLEMPWLCLESQLHARRASQVQQQQQQQQKQQPSQAAPSELTAVSRLAVNYAPELREIILEAKQLDLLQLEVPELAVNVVLQEDKHAANIDGLRKMVDRFHELMGQMDAATRGLVVAQVVCVCFFVFFCILFLHLLI